MQTKLLYSAILLPFIFSPCIHDCSLFHVDVTIVKHSQMCQRNMNRNYFIDPLKKEESRISSVPTARRGEAYTTTMFYSIKVL